MRMATSQRSQIVDVDSPTAAPAQGVHEADIEELEKPDLGPQRQDAFGDEENAEIKYKVLKWWYVSQLTPVTAIIAIVTNENDTNRQGGLLMVAETISLGILSLPAAIAGLGLVPGLIVLIGLGILATYTGWIIGQFKLRHPHISSMADAGEVLMGSFGRELLGTAQLLFLIFIMASHILTFTVAFNTITDHATCSIVFGVVGMILSIILSLPRTLAKVSWLSLICESDSFPLPGIT